MRRFRARAAGLFLAAVLAFSAFTPYAAEQQVSAAEEGQDIKELQTDPEAAREESTAAESEEAVPPSEGSTDTESPDAPEEGSREAAAADRGETADPVGTADPADRDETADPVGTADPAEPEENGGEPLEEAAENSAAGCETVVEAGQAAVESAAVQKETAAEEKETVSYPEPDWLCGGTGSKTDLTQEKRIRFHNLQAIRYRDYGLGKWETCTYEAVQDDGGTAAVMLCIDPRKYAYGLEGKYADAVNGYDTPMLVKAVYYGTGPGSAVLRKIVAEMWGDKYGAENVAAIVTHVAVSQICAKLHEADASMGSTKSSYGDGFYQTEPLVREITNRYGNELEDLPVPSGYSIYVAVVDSDIKQDFLFAVYDEKAEQAHVKFTKRSADPAVDGGNRCYSLAGAQYGVYTDAECTEEAGLLVTDEDGNSGAIDVLADTRYYVREKQAPKGYFIDDRIYEIGPLAADETGEVLARDVPGTADLEIRIRKRPGEETAENRSPAGTEFTIAYYDGYYSAEDLPEKSLRTWVIRAAGTGKECRAALSAEYLVSGSLYERGGKAVLPLGTIVIRETKAAPGFINDGEFGEGKDAFIGQIVMRENGRDTELIAVQGKPETLTGSLLSFTVYDTPETEEKQPEISTSARCGSTGTRTAPAEGTVTIIDTVSYRDFAGGREYVMSGRLTDRLTGEPAKDRTGRAVTSSARFTADSSGEGTVELEFTFEADSALEGRELVVFERAAERTSGKTVAVHEDMEDRAQTISFPSVRTAARDLRDGDKEISGKGTVTVADEVRYKNLTPGLTYIFRGVLVQKESGSPAEASGEEIRAEKTAVIREREGTEELCFQFEADGLREGEYVVFEELYEKNPDTGKETLIAGHRDLDDKAQTIYHPAPPRAAETGDKNDLRALLAMILISAVLLCAALAHRLRTAEKS